MATGTIKTIQGDRGFGFITPEGGRRGDDLFFHRSAVEGTTFEELQLGQQVTYEVQPDPCDSSRRRAVQVRLTGV